MDTRSLPAAFGLILVAVAARACGGSSRSAAPAVAPQATQLPAQIPTDTPLVAAPPPAGFPTGTYTGVISSLDDIPGTLVFNVDGTYHIFGGTAANGFDIHGVYAVSTDQITIHETTGALCDSSGLYTWQRSGKTLKLTVIKDTCAGGARSNDFAEHPWTTQT